ncbi:hypothetical protein GGI07_005446 [Coemansia sp. Benny D115]|nr:hypothetical protein GGI07_005446 [Coemansia sp. Benny D115]
MHEFKRLYGTTLVTGFAHIQGQPVGILANNGVLLSEAAQKGAHFIELCAQRGVKRDAGRLPAAEEDAFKAPIVAKYEAEGHPYYASARLWDDGVLRPQDTRRTLGLALAAARNRSPEATRFGVFRM